LARISAAIDEASMPERSWRRYVLAAAGLALIVRLVVIAATGGGFNLRIFDYFGGLIVQGTNPYDAPVGGEFSPAYGDNPPLELLLFAGLLEIHDSPDTIRIFFSLVDVAVLLTVGFFYPRSRAFRANFILLYGFNPLILEAWTGFADDKSLHLLCTIVVLIGLSKGRLVMSWVATGALGALKWYSVVFAPALAIESVRRHGLRWGAVALILFAGVLVVSQLPYFPDSLDAFSRRNDRIDINPPIHAAITQLLAEVNLYETWVPRLLVPVSLIAIYALFLLRQLSIEETVVLSVFFSYVWLPDEGFNRMILIVLPLLLITRMSVARWIALWIVSTIAAAAVLVEFRDFSFPAVESVFGAYGSVRHVIFVNVVMVTVLGFYLADRYRKRSGPRAVEAAP
jgi:hypothetical protein